MLDDSLVIGGNEVVDFYCVISYTGPCSARHEQRGRDKGRESFYDLWQPFLVLHTLITFCPRLSLGLEQADPSWQEYEQRRDHRETRSKPQRTIQAKCCG